MAGKKAQTGIEYLLIVGGTTLIALIVILLVRGTLIPQSTNTTAGESAKYFDLVKCASGNLLKNPSFEDATETKPRYWSDNGNFGSGGVTAGDYYSGERSVQLTGGVWRDFWQKVSVSSGMTYVVSVWWKGSKCGYMDYRQYQGGVPQAWNGAIGKDADSASWEQKTITMTTGATTDGLEVKLGVVPVGAGNCAAAPSTPTFFDAVCVYKQT